MLLSSGISFSPGENWRPGLTSAARTRESEDRDLWGLFIMVTSPTSSLTAAMFYHIRTLVLTIITMCGPVYQVIMTSHSSLLTPDSTVNVDQRAAKQNTHPPSGHSIIRDERTGRRENPHFTFHSQNHKYRENIIILRHIVKTLCIILMIDDI